MCFFKAFFTIKMLVYQYIFLLWTDLICSDLSMRGGIRPNVAVQEVTNGGRGVHHVHSLHVQLEQVLGCTTDQFRYDNGLKMKGCPLDQMYFYKLPLDYTSSSFKLLHGEQDPAKFKILRLSNFFLQILF